MIAVDHPDSASYPEEFIANARAVVSRVQVSWKDITVERIRGAIDRISKSKFSFRDYIFFLARVCSLEAFIRI